MGLPLGTDALPRAIGDPALLEPPRQRMLAAGMQQAMRGEHERRLRDVQPRTGGTVAADDLADPQLVPQAPCDEDRAVGQPLLG